MICIIYQIMRKKLYLNYKREIYDSKLKFGIKEFLLEVLNIIILIGRVRKFNNLKFLLF